MMVLTYTVGVKLAVKVLTDSMLDDVKISNMLCVSRALCVRVGGSSVVPS